MNMSAMIPVLLAVAFFVVLTWWQRRYQRSAKSGTEIDSPFLQEGAMVVSASAAVASPGALPEDIWWKNVSRLHQLQLALHLAGKALPVWERFAALQVVSYRAASAGPVTLIETDLLQKALEEIIVHAQLHFPGTDVIKINWYYKRFIGPVLALKDGIWVCAYPVKKVFLSVYYILLSITEQNSMAAHDNFLSAAINAALECMELSDLYTREEIASFLAAYRYRL